MTKTFQVGDRVRVTNLNNIVNGFKIGDAALVDEVMDLGAEDTLFTIRSKRVPSIRQVFLIDQIELLPPAFKEGDEVVVASRKFGHKFPIGAVVTVVRQTVDSGITAESADEYLCEGQDHKIWYLRSDELARPEEVGYADNVITCGARL